MQYCDRQELSDDQRDSMWSHITSMDAAYLTHRAKKIKAEQPKPAPSTKMKGR